MTETINIKRTRAGFAEVTETNMNIRPLSYKSAFGNHVIYDKLDSLQRDLNTEMK